MKSLYIWFAVLLSLITSCGDNNVPLEPEEPVYYIVFNISSTKSSIRHHLRGFIQDEAKATGKDLGIGMIKTQDRPDQLNIVVRKFTTREEAEDLLAAILRREGYTALGDEVLKASIVSQIEYKELLLRG